MTQREAMRAVQAGVFRGMLLGAAVLALPLGGFYAVWWHRASEREKEILDRAVSIQQRAMDSGRLGSEGYELDMAIHYLKAMEIRSRPLFP